MSRVCLTGAVAHSIELLPDDETDARIRAQWRALVDADLPSAATIRSSTNRPHVTLVAAGRISASADTAILPVAQRLPIRARLGAPIVFGGGSHHTLARLVVPSSDLLSIHAQVARLAGPAMVDDAGVPTLFAHSAPGCWTPHITLARRLSGEQVAAALAVLATVDSREPAIVFDAVRRWDSDAKSEHVLPGRAC